MYLSQMSTGSRMWPSASMTLYVRAMGALLGSVRLYDPPPARDSPDLSRHHWPDAVISGPRTGQTGWPGDAPDQGDDHGPTLRRRADSRARRRGVREHPAASGRRQPAEP